MTDQEIKEEAKRRFDSMSAEEKFAAWGSKLTEAQVALVHKTEEVGFNQLPYEDARKFRRLILSVSIDTMPGGIITGSLLKHTEEHFHLTREDIAKGAKNPYKKVCRNIILYGLVLAVVGAVLAVIGSKNDWQWLTVVGVMFEAVTGMLALKFADSVSTVSRFKKLQKKCMSGEIDEAMIKSEVAKLALEEENKLCAR